MRFSTIFFDLDDTLYPADTGLWLAIKQRMSEYMRDRIGIPAEQVAPLREQYYRQYGTSLRGLQAHHQVDVPEYLAYVHDLPLRDYLSPNPELHAILSALPVRRVIFTNADAAHAERVLSVLGLRDLFSAIVDVNAIAPYCKPMPESFGIALRLAGETDPARCLMIDDLPRTIQAAKEAGLAGLVYGEGAAADGGFSDWTRLPEILEAL